MVKEDKCPCGMVLIKEIEKKEDGGFRYALHCPKHGIVRHREPTFSEIEDFNG